MVGVWIHNFWANSLEFHISSTIGRFVLPKYWRPRAQPGQPRYSYNNSNGILVLVPTGVCLDALLV